MTEPHPNARANEVDSRFPSGPWIGFFLQPDSDHRHRMELSLTFREGTMRGDGLDGVGEFLIRGRYELDSGKCWWHKSYIGAHNVFYEGYNEGKGIWGKWEIPHDWSGGFHIWPEALPDPDARRRSQSAPIPVEFETREESLADSLLQK